MSTFEIQTLIDNGFYCVCRKSQCIKCLPLPGMMERATGLKNIIIISLMVFSNKDNRVVYNIW